VLAQVVLVVMGQVHLLMKQQKMVLVDRVEPLRLLFKTPLVNMAEAAVELMFKPPIMERVLLAQLELFTQHQVAQFPHELFHQLIQGICNDNPNL
jgi:hypothetical protein